MDRLCSGGSNSVRVRSDLDRQVDEGRNCRDRDNQLADTSEVLERHFRRLTDTALSCAPPVNRNDTSGGRPANRPPVRPPAGWWAWQAERRRRVSCSALLGGEHARPDVSEDERGSDGCIARRTCERWRSNRSRHGWPDHRSYLQSSSSQTRRRGRADNHPTSRGVSW